MNFPICRLILSVSILFFFNSISLARMDGDVSTTLLNVETDYGQYKYEIHLPKEENEYLTDVVGVLESETAKVAAYFKYAPRDAVHFTLMQGAQEANGSATVFPVNHIVLRKFPALSYEHLASSSNGVKGLIVHELVHVIHMDQTRGVIELTRRIFGSFGKLGGLVPRWFSEGIATWAESSFTSGGRLKNEMMRSSWENTFVKEDFCKTVDCLDEPGKFPYGQYAYWTGAFFMEYLESLKKGSVQCLVFANSNNIPFFLDSAFKECFSESVYSMYGKFRKSVISKYNNKEDIVDSDFTAVRNHIGEKSFQEGMVLIGDNLFSVEDEDRVSRLVLQDLSNGEAKLVDFDGRLSSISRWSKSRLSLTTFSNIRTETRRKFSVYDFEKFSPKEIRGDYNFRVSDRDISLKFNQKRWVVNKGEFLFPQSVSLSTPVATRDLIFFRSFDQRSNLTSFSVYNPKLKKAIDLATISDGFTIFDRCEEGVIARESGKLFLLDSKSKREVTLKNSQRVIFGSFEKNKSVVLLKDSKGSLYKWNKGCADLRKNSKVVESFSKNKVKTKADNKLDIQSESYPSARHFIPNHWMINYIQATDELSYWSALTTLSDPDQRHTLSLRALFYTGISEVTPDVSYLYEFPNDFFLSLGHSKKYTTSSQRQAYDSSLITSGSLSKFFEIGNFDLMNSFYVSQLEVDDFISQRKEMEYGAILKLQHIPTRRDDFFTKASVNGRFFKREVEGQKNYNGLQSILEVEAHPFSDFYLETNLAYSSLDKNDYTSGVIYGGGSYTEYHKFYGINYSDIFGNEVKSLRTSLRWELLDIYRGAGLIPIFLKELHLLAGTDIIAADRIFLGNQYLRNSSSQSYWAGISSEITVGYALPIGIDIIRTRVLNRHGDDVESTLSVIRGSFGF